MPALRNAPAGTRATNVLLNLGLVAMAGCLSFQGGRWLRSKDYLPDDIAQMMDKVLQKSDRIIQATYNSRLKLNDMVGLVQGVYGAGRQLQAALYQHLDPKSASFLLILLVFAALALVMQCIAFASWIVGLPIQVLAVLVHQLLFLLNCRLTVYKGFASQGQLRHTWSRDRLLPPHWLVYPTASPFDTISLQACRRCRHVTNATHASESPATQQRA